MGIAKNGYYSSADIRDHKAQYNIIYSGRSDGKSFDVKYYALREAWSTGKPVLGYIRRYQDDVKTELVNKYFVERNINMIREITKGQCDMIDFYRGYLWFAKSGDKIEHIQRAGEVFALSVASKRYKSTGHPDLRIFVFEEFMTDEGYLVNEPDKLEQLISTCARKDEVEVYLLGNKVSRVSPYFKQWGLHNIKRQKVGTIDDYYHNTGEFTETGEPIITKIAVEHSAPSPQKSKMFFGRTAKSIQGGAWETNEYPKLPDDLDNFDELYAITYKSVTDFNFTLKLLIHKTEAYILTFIYPAKAVHERVITGAFDPDPMVTPALSRDIKAECMIHNCFVDNKVVYSDNLTGDDFKASCESEVTYPF